MKILQFDRQLQKLIETITKLRSEDGCPWDKKQTPTTLVKYIKEETEELIHGINNNDTANICEELGDVLYLLLMITSYHEDKDDFDLGEVISQVNEKLIRRHPHVFGNSELTDEQALKQQWDNIKQAEKSK